MKIIKNLFGFVTALICGVSSCVPLTIFAENDCDIECERALTYNICDVNHDGSVDILDIIRTNRYLLGAFIPVDTTVFDTNQNLVVDMVDVEKIKAAVYGTYYNWAFYDIAPSLDSLLITDDEVSEVRKTWGEDDYSQFPIAIESNQSSVLSGVYAKYICAQNSLDTYYLNIDDETISKSSAFEYGDTRSYVGVPADVSSGIVTVETGTTIRGTGFVVGDHLIATCAHNVYQEYLPSDPRHGSLSDTHNFFPNLNIHMSNSNGSISTTDVYTVKQVHLPIKFVLDEQLKGEGDLSYSYDASCDYALLTVSETLDSSIYTHFKLGTSYDVDTSSFQNINLFVTGIYNNNVRTTKGHTYSSDPCTNNIMHYNNSTMGGVSGSPVHIASQYIKNTAGPIYNVYTVLAIHTQVNTGPRITEKVMNFYLNNNNVGY